MNAQYKNVQLIPSLSFQKDGMVLYVMALNTRRLIFFLELFESENCCEIVPEKVDVLLHIIL